MIDLDAYFARIAYGGPRVASLAVLEALHERHTGTIPFENVDVRLGRPVSLDPEALQAKLVTARRGGYCFEQNSLFAVALGALGFEVATLEARVRPPGAETVLPRTHMALRVTIAGSEWLADVGFGCDGPLRPVLFEGTVSVQPGGAFRVAAEGRQGVLQGRWCGAWRDLYAFAPEPAFSIDYDVANYFTSTHPSSPFVKALTVQIARTDGRRALRGRIYSVRTEDSEDAREVSAAEVPTLLREQFGLDLPEADLLRALGDG